MPIAASPITMTETAPLQPDAEVDARGLSCPLPILRAKKMLATLQSGQLLKVLATDPGSVIGFDWKFKK